MKNKQLIRLYEVGSKILCMEIFYYVFILVLVIFFYKNILTKEIEVESLFDLTLIFSLLLTLMTTRLSSYFKKQLESRLEDHKKLNSNYNALVKKYPRCEKMMVYRNPNNKNAKKGRKVTSINSISGYKENDKEDRYIFPITKEVNWDKKKIKIIDSINEYKLPNIVEKNYIKIMGAHDRSDVYNQLNIRLDSWEQNDVEIVLKTSRTTYFKSLVTNRAMDYKWDKNMTVRELFVPGPFLSSLEESKLSNHLGFNGHIETSDSYIIFIIRSKNVSIGKGTLGNSIGASLKTKYALNEKEIFTEEGLLKGIIEEIKDELKIEKESIAFDLSKNLIAIYRDIVEGGKPQLLFHLKIHLSKKEIEENFYKKLTEENKKDSGDLISKMLVDGKKLLFIKKEELKELYITPDVIVHQKKAYKVMPSVSASTIILMEYIEKEQS